MTLADVLERILRDEPDQTPEELYRNLGSVKSKVRQPQMVATALKRDKDRFVADDDGRWRLVNQPDPEPEPEIDLERLRPKRRNQTGSRDEEPDASPRRDAQSPRESNGQTADPSGHVAQPRTPVGTGEVQAFEMENELRSRLGGAQLIAEVGLDEDDLDEQEQVLTRLVQTGVSIETVGRRFPMLLLTYVVGVGVFRSDERGLWTNVNVPKLTAQNAAVIERSIEQLGVETFEQMVEQENALRFLGPILGHGGIPRRSLDDYFGLLARGMKKAARATDLLMLWQSQQSSYATIDKPIGRFLRFGGDLSADFLDRSIDLLGEYARSGTIAESADVGLPDYVVEGFRSYVNSGGEVSVGVASKVRRTTVRVVLDPWAGAGPVAVLPMVPDATTTHLVWHVRGGSQIQSLPASAAREKEVELEPARSWTVELTDPSLRGEWMVRGLDEQPALFFHSGTGELIHDGAALRGPTILVLRPAEVSVTGTRIDRTDAVPPVVQELPEPGGAWSGFVLEMISVEDLRTVLLEQPGKDPVRVPVRAAAVRPQLLDEPIPGLTDASGNPVFAAMPRIELPGAASGETLWRLRLDDGATRTLDLDALSSDGDIYALPATTRCGTYSLVASGPLGADLRTRFAVAPGLTAAVPDRVLFPGESATVSMSAPRLAISDRELGAVVDLVVDSDSDRVEADVRDPDGNTIQVQARLSRVMWGIVGPTSEGLATRELVLKSDELRESDAPRLVVRTGRAGHELRLSLSADHEEIQRLDAVTTGSRDGRWVFGLDAFADTVTATDRSGLVLNLWIGIHPIPIARIRPSLSIEDLAVDATPELGGHKVTVSFTAARVVQHRVVRLWSLSRPWEEPITHPVPDDFDGTLAIESGVVPDGAYVAQIAVDDGWTPAERPRPRDAGTALIELGRLEPIDDLDESPFARDPRRAVELALEYGYFGRHLEQPELDHAVPAAAMALLALIRGELLIDWTSRQLGSVAAIALADSSPLLAELLSEAEDGGATRGDLLRLAIALGPRTRLVDDPSGSIMRKLWDFAPALAASFDVEVDDDEARHDRIHSATGWVPTDVLDPVGEPVSQMFVGVDLEQLQTMSRSMELIPREVLGLDRYVEATFEWLINARRASSNPVELWMQRHRDLVRRSASDYLFAAEHLVRRTAPQGTAPWASFPRVTLACAISSAVGDEDHFAARQALMDATEFAPKLVERDLVLGRALAAINAPSPRTPGDPS